MKRTGYPKAVDAEWRATIKLLAAEESREKKLFEVDFTIPCAVILGAEGEGISEELMRKADENFSIPMTGKIGSFNVSVAAGIVLYEMMRQRVAG